MKQVLLFLAFSTSLFFSSCEGDPGPPGPPGADFLGQVIEVTVDFNQANNYSQFINFNDFGVEVFESDVVLVYLLEGVDGDVDIWSQLPQTFFLEQGTLLYTFDHTFFDTRIFLDANFPLNTLGSTFTNDQTFRIAVVPAEFADANLTMEQLLNLDVNMIETQNIEQ
ncbi:hypothetical protein MG296_08780 [Flavobacteriaceae bacterium TK19130]|nr:hypothetical protein [Thermobacterium salinum]